MPYVPPLVGEETGPWRACLTQSLHLKLWALWPCSLEGNPAVLTSLSTHLPLHRLWLSWSPCPPCPKPLSIYKFSQLLFPNSYICFFSSSSRLLLSRLSCPAMKRPWDFQATSSPSSLMGWSFQARSSHLIWAWNPGTSLRSGDEIPSPFGDHPELEGENGCLFWPYKTPSAVNPAFKPLVSWLVIWWFLLPWVDWRHPHGVLSFAAPWGMEGYPWPPAFHLHHHPFLHQNVCFMKLNCSHLNSSWNKRRLVLGFMPCPGPAVALVSFGGRGWSLLEAHKQVWFVCLQKINGQAHMLKHRQTMGCSLEENSGFSTLGVFLFPRPSWYTHYLRHSWTLLLLFSGLQSTQGFSHFTAFPPFFTPSCPISTHSKVLNPCL